MRQRQAGMWQAGWWSGAVRIDSPNFDARPNGERVDLLVIHHISLPPGYFAGDAIERLFCNTLNHDAHPYFGSLRQTMVSAHFLVRRHGGIRQFVGIHDRAWHAGRSTFGERTNCNNFSVGVEMEGDDQRPFTNAQYRKLAMLVQALRTQLPLTFVTGHSDIAPGRKVDPGPLFDWSRVLAEPAMAGLKRDAGRADQAG